MISIVKRLCVAMAFIPFGLLAAPLAPTDLALTPIEGAVELVWQDKAWDETGYKIFRDEVLIFTTAPNQTTYVDTTVEPNHTYTYTVKATDDAAYQPIVYEDAENDASMWEVSDADPAGATVQSVYDADRKSQVIELQGDGFRNSYLFGNYSGHVGVLGEKNRKRLTLSMNFPTQFRFTVIVDTTKGMRFLYYTNESSDRGIINTRYIHHGLGSGFSDGKWHIFSRELEKDLQEYEPDNVILSVDGIEVSGSGKIDDIILSENVPTLAPTIIDDFEEGIPAAWRILHNEDEAQMQEVSPSFNDSLSCIRLEATGGAVQNVYTRPVYNAAQTVLEIEVGGFDGINRAHYVLGVRVMTLDGIRIMEWDSWNNHEGKAPRKSIMGENIFLSYPSPIELVRGWEYAPQDQIETFRVSLNEQLRLLEPNNRVLQVETFIAGGGFLDNIKLLSQ